MIRSLLLGFSAAAAAGLLFVNLYNSMVDAPNWGADLPKSILAAREYFAVSNPGNFFRVFSPLNQALAVIAVFICWRNNRYLALASLTAAILLDVLTFSYFYPRNEVMFIAPVNEEAIRLAWQQWSNMNWLRTALCGINTVLAFTLLVVTSKTFSK
jgi:hypothetical protein